MVDSRLEDDASFTKFFKAKRFKEAADNVQMDSEEQKADSLQEYAENDDLSCLLHSHPLTDKESAQDTNLIGNEEDHGSVGAALNSMTLNMEGVPGIDRPLGSARLLDGRR